MSEAVNWAPEIGIVIQSPKLWISYMATYLTIEVPI